MEGFPPPSLSSYLNYCHQHGSLPCLSALLTAGRLCKGGNVGDLGAVMLLFCLFQRHWKLSSLPFASNLNLTPKAASSQAMSGGGDILS